MSNTRNEDWSLVFTNDDELKSLSCYICFNYFRSTPIACRPVIKLDIIDADFVRSVRIFNERRSNTSTL